MEKIKLLYLTPHLSTGGMPQFVLKRIESLQKYKDKLDIFDKGVSTIVLRHKT